MKPPRGGLALAVDIGTSSIKGAVIDTSGRDLRHARVPFSDIRAEEGSLEAGGLWDPGRWERGFIELLKRLFPGGAAAVDGISISGNGPSVVPLGPDGRPCAGALLWHDRRERRLGGDPSFFLPKMAWFLEHLPRVRERVTAFLGCPEYLGYLLSGELCFYTPSESFNRHLWTAEGAALYGVPLDLLPPPAETGTRVGSVSRAAALRFGLPEGVPVAAGGSDFLMALLGSGVVRPGMTCDRAGTSEGINYCSEEKIAHPRVRTLPHAVSGYYNVAGILSATGLVFEWFRRLTGQGGRDYEEMLEEIEKAAFYPGPLFFPSLHRGAVWEFSGGAFAGLQPAHGPVELGVAVVSAIGFGIRDCIEGLAEAGCPVTEMRVCGGQGRSAVWNRMKADITGTPLLIPSLLDCELTGAAASVFAMLEKAGSAAGAAESLVAIAGRYEPDPRRARSWDTLYRHYCDRRDRFVNPL